MVDGVRGGNGPLEPNVPKILMVGFLAGMAIPVFLCVVAAMLDSSVKRRKEIETLTSIPVYGELPRKPRKLKNQEIVVNLEEPSELSECFPLLAERMVALSDGNEGNPLSVLITSTCSGEGKTYLSVNLALSLAVAGKKVLLVDADPQASLTISLGNPQPDKLPFTLSDAMGRILMDEPIKPGEGILHHPEGVDLMPADIQLSGMEVSLVLSLIHI